MLLELQGVKSSLDGAEVLRDSLLALIVLVIVLLQHLDLTLLRVIAVVYKIFELNFSCSGLSLLTSLLLLYVELLKLFLNLLRV